MVITGKIKLFVETKQAEEGRKFKVFSTSIGTKYEDGYLNKSMKVFFVAENFPAEKLNKLQDNKVYEVELIDAWLGVRGYKLVNEENPHTEFYLMINKAQLTGSKEINKKKETDLPF